MHTIQNLLEKCVAEVFVLVADVLLHVALQLRLVGASGLRTPELRFSAALVLLVLAQAAAPHVLLAANVTTEHFITI
jgi:hypothetical protein